jgi:hypothetical protein
MGVVSDRSKFNPNPCTPSEVANNWRMLHWLLSRFPWEPTEDDHEKLVRWNNTFTRFQLVSPCQAVEGCGGSGGECATPGTFASGITPETKTLTLGGTITATGGPNSQDILDNSPYTLICDGADRYTYLDGDHPDGILALTLNLLETSASIEISVGALTGSASWELTGLADPYDYEADIDDTYALATNTSSQFDAASLTAAISA